ncbi:hypothetical protein [Sinomonas mesophila]|uniref:hypothetical protein n=1 Tax=Sinomonas mesophila TaxID=1531955 RepID=UPI000984580D|nr:hypothetical protein [Sinomonas mesophila]
MNENVAQHSAPDLRRVGQILKTIGQGDVISLGAVNIVGVGASAAWHSIAEHEGMPEREPGEELWSLSIESDVEWYVVITQDCDIVRDPSIEPCLVVCPIKYVPKQEWQRFASGPTSPRFFAFPDSNKLPGLDGLLPVADLRFVTSVDKTAILHESVRVLHPLSAPQRAGFGRWVGARYARVPHPDNLERDVLPKAAKIIRDLAARYAAGDRKDPEVRLVGATSSWYLGGNDKRVVFIPLISEATAKACGLWKAPSVDFDHHTIETAEKRLASKIRASLPSGAGYASNVSARTLQSASAADLLEWSEWIVEN